MFAGFSEKKTKVQLKMNVERLKLLQGKKINQSKTRKREIAKLLEQGKDESARVMVEHVIREDFIVEAYEIMEVQTQLLLARIGVIEQSKTCPDDIREAICSLVWASDRCMDVSELKEITKQMKLKYGKEFIETARNFANPKVVHKLSIRAPDETLINSYLNEIARVYGVDWEAPIEAPSQSLMSSLNFVNVDSPVATAIAADPLMPGMQQQQQQQPQLPQQPDPFGTNMPPTNMVDPGLGPPPVVAPVGGGAGTFTGPPPPTDAAPMVDDNNNNNNNPPPKTLDFDDGNFPSLQPQSPAPTAPPSNDVAPPPVVPDNTPPQPTGPPTFDDLAARFEALKKQ